MVYNTALATCVSSNELNKAHFLLEEIVEIKGMADVIITYNTLAEGYAFEAVRPHEGQGHCAIAGDFWHYSRCCTMYKQMDKTWRLSTLVKVFARAVQVDKGHRYVRAGAQ